VREEGRIKRQRRKPEKKGKEGPIRDAKVARGRGKCRQAGGDVTGKKEGDHVGRKNGKGGGSKGGTAKKQEEGCPGQKTGKRGQRISSKAMSR